RLDGKRLLAGAGLDVARRAGLEVRDTPGNRVLDAVSADSRRPDRDVLDPGVVAGLELREVHAGVARAVVDVVRLHAGDRPADVRLRRRGVGPVAKRQVRGDRDR